MKKIYSYLLLPILLMVTSCSMQMDVTYHNDAAMSMYMNMDMKDFMTSMTAMMPDSAKSEGEMSKLTEKYPKEWTSLYDLQLQSGEKVSTDPDSIRLLKKSFMKSNFDNGEFTGFAMKMDHMTQDEFKSFKKTSTDQKIPMEAETFGTWDGKKLTINTDQFNSKKISEAMNEGMKEAKAEEGEEYEDEGDETLDSEKLKAMLKMMQFKLTTNLKFDNKIISIKGKHDIVRQIDDHTVALDFDLDTMLDEKHKFKNEDKEVVITTE